MRGTRHTGHRGGLLLVPAAAVAVHQLRYMLAYGSRAGSELAAQGHSYLHSLVPWTILVLALGAGSFLRRAAHALRTGDGGPARLSAGALWLATFAGLLAIYAVQETLEGTLATGHPGGVGGVLGHGGWWSIPAAAAVALVVTALLLVGRVLLRVAAAARRVVPRRTPARTAVPVGVAAAVVRPLARAAAGRAPPSLLPA